MMHGQEDIEGLLTFLVKRINELEQTVLGQKSEIEELRARLSDYETKKDSTNSSKPPSSAYGNRPKPQSLRKGSGEKVGGQPGHKGHSLKMSATPDQIEECHPLYCSCCGNDLSGVPSEEFGRRQIIDIPETVSGVTEYLVYKKVCRCGHVSKGEYPPGVESPVSYGKNTQALIACLSCRQYIPYKRLEEILKHIFGLSICQGSIRNSLNKTSQKLMLMYKAIRKSVLNSPVIGGDETSANINGKDNRISNRTDITKRIMNWIPKVFVVLMIIQLLSVFNKMNSLVVNSPCEATQTNLKRFKTINSIYCFTVI